MKYAHSILFSLLCFVMIPLLTFADTWLEDPDLGWYASQNCVACCDCSNFRVDAEYLYWQTKESPKVIPLVFTGIFDPNVTPTLQTSGTKIVLGNEATRRNGHSGGKLTVGYNYGGPWMWDSEISYTLFSKRIHSKSVQSNDFKDDDVSTPVFPDNSFLAIPFFDVTTNMQSSTYIAEPDSFAGKATLKTSHWLQGIEWNISALLPVYNCDWNFSLRGLAGVRFWNFNDKLSFKTNSPNTQTPNVFITHDKFETQNYFYGAQVGFIATYAYKFISLTIKAKVAVGGMNERLKILGKLATNNFDIFGDVQVFQAGYFALPTNIGFYDQWKAAALPEVNLNLAFNFCDCATLNAGFNFIYVSNVLWAENQLNSRINTTQAPAITGQPITTRTGIAEPKALLKPKDFWMYGLNCGLEIRF